MKLGRSGGNTQVFSLTYGFTRVMRSCDCACNREADTAGLEPAASHCVDTVVDAGALPIRAICPVILFWATSWANHPRGGQTPFTDRGGQWFRGRTNPDCRICVVLHHEMPAVWAFKLRTGISRTPIRNMVVSTTACHCSGIISVAIH